MANIIGDFELYESENFDAFLEATGELCDSVTSTRDQRLIHCTSNMLQEYLS